jgi:hypothetical protein
MLRRRLGIVCIGILCLLALANTGCSRRPGSSHVASNVQNRIRNDSRMQMARVQVLATNGVVTLSGYVTSLEQRLATVEDASQVEGVRVVVDNLRVVDANPQNPVIAMQKPSASVARLVSPHVSRLEAPVIVKAGAVHAVASPAADPVTSNRTSNQTPDQTKDQTKDQTATPHATATNSTPSAVNATAAVRSAPIASDSHAPDPEAPAVRTRIWPVGASSVPRPATVVPPAAPEQVTVPNGTELVVRMTESVSSDLNEKGDTFLASLASPIMVGDRVVIPADAGVEGKVVDVQSAGRFSGRPKLAIELTRLTYNGKTYELHSSKYSKQGASRDARSVAVIGGGAGVGAIIGAILGGGRGAAIGSVIGAGAGTGAQATSKPPQVKLPAETVLSVRLQTALTVIPSSSLQRTRNAGPGSPQDPFSSDDDRPVLKRRPGSAPPDTDSPDRTPHPDNN